ncbi:3'-5' exonuclease [Klebsormidium nitens]|uniref:3'-5' exonuclease n=1 Tax=Klebsormidium nitens TaxID=105231 RepID=A0A1Y1HQX7_KLENI|nr:3'-5' exonuclease [Klebsormidium nitens]|eukprot:GAQ78996.1 3'-5' exonuclease [Klebsormidium nitens]
MENASTAEKVDDLHVNIVTEPSQLPLEFLEPSHDRQVAIGFDCEGVSLSREGNLTLIQLAFPDAIYLVDILTGGAPLIKACKLGLESPYVTKIIHDCKRDSEALFFQFGIKLHGVFDTQIAYALLEELQGAPRVIDQTYISFVKLLEDKRYGGRSYKEKLDVRAMLRKDETFWARRPMTEQMKRVAAGDVRYLPELWATMNAQLDVYGRWQLRARGELSARCFCIGHGNSKESDWPPVPPMPDHESYDKRPYEEALVVVEVPAGKMGRVIGRKGEAIVALKKSVEADIFTGGIRGPPDKIFLIGPVNEVKKGEAIIRGHFISRPRQFREGKDEIVRPEEGETVGSHH